MSVSQRALVSALTLLAACGSALAIEVPAAFDSKNCRAEYPKASLMNEEEGVTSALFLVSATGAVVEAKLDKTSGFKSLDRAAINAISACKFKPGTKDGKPDQTWTKVDYHWKISS